MTLVIDWSDGLMVVMITRDQDKQTSTLALREVGKVVQCQLDGGAELGLSHVAM